VSQLVDVLEHILAFVVLLEELVKERASDCIVLRHSAKKLNHLGQMVISLAVVLALSRIE